MRLATRRPVRLALLVVLGCAAVAHGSLRAVEAAPPVPGASAASSASAAAGDVGPGKRGLAVSAYAWPTEVSPAPKEEDWAGATDLETVVFDLVPALEWWPVIKGISCAQRALGAWLRVTCTPSHAGSNDTLLGAVWALSGDAAKAKATFTLAAELERYQKGTDTFYLPRTRQMGASATVTFPVAQGSALLLRIDQIGWDDGYEGSSVFTQPGILVDVSWAAGEKSPTITYR